MLETQVIIYQKANGKSPLMSWLSRQNQRVQEKARELIALLKERGYRLGPPLAKPLREGIWELRIIVQGVQYRILYAFVGRGMALLTHGLRKTDIVPPDEIDKAVRYKSEYQQSPEQHTYRT